MEDLYNNVRTHMQNGERWTAKTKCSYHACMYVCARVYVCACVHMCMRVHACAHVYVCSCVHMCMCVCVCMCVPCHVVR